jgi:hypothetical protein
MADILDTGMTDPETEQETTPEVPVDPYAGQYPEKDHPESDLLAPVGRRGKRAAAPAEADPDGPVLQPVERAVPKSEGSKPESTRRAVTDPDVWNNELVFEEPPPKERRAGIWLERLEPVTRHPGQWVKWGPLAGTKTGERYAGNLKKGKMVLPATGGLWEFTSRSEAETDVSWLYSRWTPDGFDEGSVNGDTEQEDTEADDLTGE